MITVAAALTHVRVVAVRGRTTANVDKVISH